MKSDADGRATCEVREDDAAWPLVVHAVKDERSGMTRAAISKLENGWNVNPTLDTLFRYATAIGAYVKLSVEELQPPRSELA